MYQCNGNFCKGDASRLAKRALHFSECKISVCQLKEAYQRLRRGLLHGGADMEV